MNKSINSKKTNIESKEERKVITQVRTVWKLSEFNSLFITKNTIIK